MKRETPSRAQRPWGFVLAIAAVLVSACAHARPLVEHPSSALCAHVDPAQKRLVVVGRWRDHDVRVAIDTGGTDGSVSKGRAASLVARPGKHVRYAGASGQWIDASVYDVEGLSLGTATLATFPASDMALLDDEGFDFQIGVDQLAPYVVDLAMNEGLVCLRSDLPVGVAPASLSTLTRTGGDIMVEATIAGKRFPKDRKMGIDPE